MMLYLHELLPIEMIMMCDIASFIDPIMIFFDENEICANIWDLLSDNPMITTHLILKYKHQPWDWDSLSANRAVDLKFISDHPEFPWKYEYLSENANLTVDFVVKNLFENWNWYWVSQSKSITMGDIDDNPFLRWNYKGISSNPNLTIEFVLEKLNKDWDWSCVSYNKGITMDDVYANYQIPWEPRRLVLNPNLTMTFILSGLIDLNNFTTLFRISKNKGINILDIETNPTFPWNYNGLSNNQNITLRFIMQNTASLPNDSFEQWDWSSLSRNKGITLEDLNHYPNLPWCNDQLTECGDYNLEFVLKNNPKRQFDHNSISVLRNGNIFVY